MGGENYKSKRIRATVLKNRNGAEFDSFPCMIPISKGSSEIFAYRIEEVPKHVLDMEAMNESNRETDDNSGNNGKIVNQNDYGKKKKPYKKMTPPSQFNVNVESVISEAEEYFKSAENSPDAVMSDDTKPSNDWW